MQPARWLFSYRIFKTMLRIEGHDHSTSLKLWALYFPCFSPFYLPMISYLLKQLLQSWNLLYVMGTSCFILGHTFSSLDYFCFRLFTWFFYLSEMRSIWTEMSSNRRNLNVNKSVSAWFIQTERRRVVCEDWSVRKYCRDRDSARPSGTTALPA